MATIDYLNKSGFFMKKGLKVLALGALALPLGLLSACGGQLDFGSSLNVNNAGAYKEVMQAEFTTYVSQEVEGEDVVNKDMSSGLKFVYEANADGTNLKVNAIIKMTDANKVEMATKMTASKPGENGGNAAISMYYPGEETFYADMNISYRGQAAQGNMKGQYSFDVNTSSYPGGMGPEEILSIVSSVDVDNIAAMLSTYTDAVVSKAESGDKLNYKIEIKSDSTYQPDTYYIMFKNDVLVGVKLETEYGIIAMERFDGEIEYPNFENYVNYEEYLQSLIK